MSQLKTAGPASHVDAGSLFSSSNLYLDTSQQYGAKVAQEPAEQKQPAKKAKKSTEQGMSQQVAATSEDSKPKKDKKAKKASTTDAQAGEPAISAGKAGSKAKGVPDNGTSMEAAAPPGKKPAKGPRHRAVTQPQSNEAGGKQKQLTGQKRKAQAEEQEDAQQQQQQQQEIKHISEMQHGSDSDDDIEGAEGNKQDATKPKRAPEEEAERLTRTLFVGNLPASMTRKGLKKLLSTYGQVDSVRLRSVPLDPNSKLPRRAAVITGKVDMKRAPAVAYVVFTQKADADKALELNMTVVDDHHIQVDRASQPAKKATAATAAGAPAASGSTEYDPGRTLFCGNLHFQVTNEEIIQFFTSPENLQGNPELEPAAHGGKPAVEAVRVVRDPATSLGKGFAFVMFRNKAAARAALSLNGREIHKRPVRLTRVSVQQQARVKRERDIAAAGKASKLGGPKRGGVSKPSTCSTEPSQWQGTKTKGKGKGLRGHKDAAAQGGKKPAGAAPSGKASSKAGGKRPAVAARKKQMKLQKAKSKAKGAQA